MKKIYVLALMCAMLGMSAVADAQTVVVNKADGNKIVLPSKKVSSITTSTSGDAESLDYYTKTEADNLHSELKGYCKAYTDGATSANKVEIDALKEKISSLEGTIAALQSENSKLSTTNTELQSQIQALTSLLATLQADVDKLKRGTDTHEYVDLGLPSGTLWATCNIGAENPEDYGDYFAWGETTGYNSGKTAFSWSTYTLCNGSYTTLTKYCTDSSYGTVDNKTELDPEDDAAYVNWGSDWCMPTETQQDELRTSCTWTWTTQNDVNGYKVTGTNGNSIFLPAAGYRYSGSLDGTGSYGYYWSSELNSSYSYGAWLLYFGSSDVYSYYGDRYCGQCVRPVRCSASE